MDELKQQQIEALQVAEPYCEKMAIELEKLIEEYTSKKLPDTDEYMKHILNGLNWLFEVYNGTQDLVKEGSVAVDKDAVNQSVMVFNEGMKVDDDMKKAEGLKGILVFVNSLEEASKKLTA